MVHLIGPKKNVVVPHGWVRGIAGHIETLINDGVNRHRRYFVFYTNNPAAFTDPGTNRMPSENFAPDLNASHSSSYPSEGWYEGLIYQFKGDNLNNTVNLIIKI